MVVWASHKGRYALKNHLDELNSILIDLHNINIKIDSEDVVMILLVSLRPSYENFVSLVSVRKNNMTLEEARASLYEREI